MAMIPELPRENCDACAKGGGFMNSTCRSCMARYLTRLSVPARAKWFVTAAEVHSQAVVDAFKAEVAAWVKR
ncbi:MAG: hypothetical protein AB7I42_25880 [Bradyrhizobium sp.]|uniref:hypothetical protein n=1 Tax=Bradyrhizobium sp. TaxID=376 RepID=UPI003D14B89A